LANFSPQGARFSSSRPGSSGPPPGSLAGGGPGGQGSAPLRRSRRQHANDGLSAGSMAASGRMLPGQGQGGILARVHFRLRQQQSDGRRRPSRASERWEPRWRCPPLIQEGLAAPKRFCRLSSVLLRARIWSVAFDQPVAGRSRRPSASGAGAIEAVADRCGREISSLASTSVLAGQIARLADGVADIKTRRGRPPARGSVTVVCRPTVLDRAVGPDDRNPIRPRWCRRRCAPVDAQRRGAPRHSRPAGSLIVCQGGM